MADEAAVLEQEQETQEENLESQDQNQEQEEAEKPEGEETEGQETPEKTEEGQEEYWESEEDYNESLGLGRRTNAQVATYLKEVEAKAEAYRQTNPTWNPQPQHKEPPKEGEFKFFPNRGLAAKQLEAMQFPATQTDPDGRIAKSGWAQVAKMFDSALDPIFDHQEEVLQKFGSYIAQIADHLQRQSYQGVKRKDLAPFEKIEPYMKQNFILDANKAVQRYLVDNNPDLLVQLAKDAERAGEKKGQQFKFKKNSATRRTKPTQQQTAVWTPYLDKNTGELSREKMGMAGLSSQKQYEISTAWVKHLESKES